MSYKKRAFQKIEITTDREKKNRIERAERNFQFFAQYYLPHIFSRPFAPFQLEIIEYLSNPEMKRVVIAAPRQHGKTSLVYVGYILWAALFKKHLYMVTIGASEERAKEALENILMELEENPRIAEDFGEDIARRTRADRIELTNGVLIISKGAGQRLRGLLRGGRRPDLILLDDIESEEHAYSKSLRDKLKRWFYRAVMGLSKDAKVFVIGTIIHYDSLLNELLEKGKQLGWFARKYRAIEDGKPLHPYLWTIEELEKKKKEIGSMAFASEYMNEPLSDEDRMFREEWIQYYEPHEVGNLKIKVMAIDPATGKSRGDYSAIVVVGKDENGIIYVLDAVAGRTSDLKFIETIIDRYQMWKPHSILFEEVAFQEIYKNMLMREASRKGIHLPIRPVKPRASKEMRIQKLSPLIENGLIRFRKNQKLLIEQLLMFPKGDHDDLPDALAYAVDGLSMQGTGKILTIKRYLRLP